MWKISQKALDYLNKNQINEITVEEPIIINGCCIPVSEPPIITLREAVNHSSKGDKRKRSLYVTQNVEGIIINLPPYLSGLEVTIDLSQFLHRKKLVIEGWNLV